MQVLAILGGVVFLILLALINSPSHQDHDRYMMNGRKTNRPFKKTK